MLSIEQKIEIMKIAVEALKPAFLSGGDVETKVPVVYQAMVKAIVEENVSGQ